MKVKDIIIYRGRNIHSHRPVMKMIVDIGKYGEIPTKDIPGFHEKLLATFPGLAKNTCSLGYEGGFLERLREGTYLGHVLEHVILDLENSVGYDVKYGKTRVIKEPSLYYIVYEYANEATGLECGKAGAFILDCFLKGEEVNVSEFLDYLKKVSLESELGPSTSAIVEEAKKRGIPVTRIGHESLVQLGYGKYARLIESTLTDATSCISADIASNKQLTKSILSEYKIPVPYGKVVYSEISAVMAANLIGLPVVVKPFDGNQGKGVYLNLKTEKEIKKAFREASKYSSGVIVEQYILGKDYRVLVVGGKVCAVAQRKPAAVTGDGRRSIKELIEIVNSDPDRGEHHEKKLTKIRLDVVAKNFLASKGLDENYVPAEGEEVLLRENGNLSTGGIAIDCTDIIHPDNAQIAVRAASAIGIDIAGIDIVTQDISKSILECGGAVVEVNSAPGIRMHLYPSVGKPRNVAKDIVDLLYPNDDFLRFTIASVTGTNGKTTTVRLISHVLELAGRTVGMTSTSGTYINGRCICKGDNSGPRSAKALLSNREIDAAVLETARGGIIREGLGYDLADVGVVTNIADDHLGTDGIETIEDLAFVKALVIEAVKPGGWAVLNADDGMTDYLIGRAKSRIILFHKNPETKYGYEGFIHVYVDGGIIKIRNGRRVTDVIAVEDIPITYGGAIQCNVYNALAAVAALRGLNVPIEKIRRGIASFYENKGRFNIYEMGPYKIMLDYAHNRMSYEEVIKSSKTLSYNRLVGIVGMPGDRPDEAIRAVGRLCAKAFDRIYVKEDDDLRGRRKGEVAGIITSELIRSGFPKGKITEVDDERQALGIAMSNAREGDLIVVLYEKMEPLVEIIERERAKINYFQDIGAIVPPYEHMEIYTQDMLRAFSNRH